MINFWKKQGITFFKRNNMWTKRSIKKPTWYDKWSRLRCIGFLSFSCSRANVNCSQTNIFHFINKIFLFISIYFKTSHVVWQTSCMDRYQSLFHSKKWQIYSILQREQHSEINSWKDFLLHETCCLKLLKPFCAFILFLKF